MKLSDDVAIFWDYENCPVPNNSSGYAVANSITSMARPFGRVRLFRAYLEITDQLSLRSELQSSGVSLVDCPHNGRKEVADKMILVDMLTYVIDNPTPCTIIVISGDRDFAYALSMLKIRHFQMVLVTLPNAHVSLTSQASLRYDWTSTSRTTISRPTAGHFQSTSIAHVDSQYNRGLAAQDVIAPSHYTTLQSAKSYTTPITSINAVESDETPEITHILRQHSERQLSLAQRSDNSRTAGRPESGSMDPLSFANVTASQNVKHVHKYEDDHPFVLDAASVPSRSLNGQTVVADPPAVRTVSITTPPVDIETSNNATSSLEARRFPQDQFTISVASIVPGQNEDTPSAQGRETEGLPESERQSQSDDEIEVTSQQFGQGTGVAECSEDNSEPSSPSSTIEPAPVPAESGSATPVLQTPFTFSTKLDDEDLETGVALSTIHDEDIGIESLSDNGGFVGQTSTVHQLSSPPRVLDNLSDGDLGRLNSPVTQVQSSDRISEVDDQVKGKGTRSRASTTNSCASFPDSRETTFSFDILETVLDQLRDGGIRRPLRSTVAVLISANGEKYENAASEDINHYIEWALAEELISGGGEGDKAWITLRRDMNNDVPDRIEELSKGDTVTVLPPADRQPPVIWSNPPIIPFEMSPSKFVEPTPSMPYSPMLSMPLAAPFVSQQWSTTGSQALVMPPSNYGLGARTTVSQPQFSSKPTLKKVETKVVHTPTNNASTSSAKPVASSTQRHIPPHFVILVQSLQANRNSGERRTLRTDLSLQIANDGRTYERAGVTKFRSYLNLAVQEGIVELGGNDADAWVRLRPDWYNAIPTPTTSKRKPIPSEFVELVKALQAFRQEGIYKPVRSQVASQMSKGVYKKAGVSKWSQYADLAVSEGIVKLGVSDGQDWISLHSKWHHAVF